MKYLQEDEYVVAETRVELDAIIQRMNDADVRFTNGDRLNTYGMDYKRMLLKIDELGSVALLRVEDGVQYGDTKIVASFGDLFEDNILCGI